MILVSGPKIVKDTPLAEVTLRKYERPNSLSGRDLVRKFCLTIGLLQPGDSRDVVVDVLHVMLMNKDNTPLTSKEVEDLVKKNRKEHDEPQWGVAPSNIRRQLLRCRRLFLVEKVKAAYRITENLSIQEIFAEKLEQYYIDSILRRTKEYVHALNNEFFNDNNE